VRLRAADLAGNITDGRRTRSSSSKRRARRPRLGGVIVDAPPPVPAVRTGTSGDDQFVNAAGEEIFLGFAGTDTLVFDFALGSAAVSQSGALTVLTGPGGARQLLGHRAARVRRPHDPARRRVAPRGRLFYLARNPDVARSGLDADDHYFQFGAREGRDPNAFFSTRGYLSANGDVRDAGVNPLTHYDQFGWREGRDPSAAFDTQGYLRINPDVARAGLDPLAHFLAKGAGENRAIATEIGRSIGRAGFDAEFYLLSNPDIGEARLDAGRITTIRLAGGPQPERLLRHPRLPRNLYDVRTAGRNPLDHYDTNGWRENRDPSARFDTSDYRGAYGDVAAATINPLQHFLQFGAQEGRSAFGDGVLG
jgi:hypothetical protein